MQNDVTRLDACEKYWSNSSHRQGKLNNSKWPVKIFPGDDYYWTSISRGHQAM
jgi:hypothetical protein